MIRFTVDGPAHGKARPRFTRSGHAYTDAKTESYESRVWLACREAMNGQAPYQGGVLIGVRIRMAPPASVSKKKRAQMVEGQVLPLKKPDIDNVFKSIADGCNGVAYLDDKQIVGLDICKRYAEASGVDVTIEEVTASSEADKWGDHRREQPSV